MNKTEFQKELTQLINKESMESGSNTPDFLLAEYLTDCLEVYDRIIMAREKWYGREPKPVCPEPDFPSPMFPPSPEMQAAVDKYKLLYGDK